MILLFCNNCHRRLEAPPGADYVDATPDQFGFLFCSDLCRDQFKQEKERYRKAKAGQERYHRFWTRIGEVIMESEDEEEDENGSSGGVESLFLASTMLRAYADLLDAFLRETNPDLDKRIFSVSANFTKMLGERVTTAYFDSLDEKLRRRAAKKRSNNNNAKRV